LLRVRNSRRYHGRFHSKDSGCRFRAVFQRVPGGAESGRICDGPNVAIEYRWAEGETDRLAALVPDLVRGQVAEITPFN